MDFLAVSEPGFEEVTLLELKERCNVVGKIIPCGVVFSADWPSALRMAFRGQSVRRVLLLAGQWKIKSDVLPPEKEKSKILNALKEFMGDSFKVEVERTGEHEFTCMEAAESLGDIIHTELGTKVDLKHPSTLVFCVVRDKSVAIGVDLSGFDLGKRAYKVFTGSGSLRGTVAYGALRLAGVSSDSVVINGQCGSGELSIESALMMEDVSVRMYEKEKFSFARLPFVPKDAVENVFVEESVPGKGSVSAFDNRFPSIVAAKKNSKIAGVKDVRFSRCELEWLDTKLDKKSADFIVVRSVEASKTVSERDAQKFVKELTYQAEYVLKPKGKLIVLAHHAIEIPGFKIEKDWNLKQGAEGFVMRSWVKSL
jgi:23S rRNA G2445 N2-methylase RlmL